MNVFGILSIGANYTGKIKHLICWLAIMSKEPKTYNLKIGHACLFMNGNWGYNDTGAFSCYQLQKS